MREYEKNANATKPDVAWKEVVWHAASLMRLAKTMRNTIKNSIVKPIDEPFKQGDLFYES